MLRPFLLREGALAPARFRGVQRRKSRGRLRFCASLCIILFAPSCRALADERDRLAPGLYVAATVGCDGLGGGGTVDFDGKNFSPHYQACLTQALSQNARYRQTCIEGQGANYPTTAQIQGDPSKTMKDVTIAVLSRNAFSMNGVRYDYCGAR
jgi:hypothetical protein